MAWPTTTTSTTNIDADSDSISEARFEIFKNFKDVNSITDEFNIGTPSEKDTLIFNSNTNKFDLGGMVDLTNLGQLGFSGFGDTGNPNTYDFFDGTFTAQNGSSDLGITTSSNSDGDTVATFPSGNYVISIPLFTPAPQGTASSGGFSQTFTLQWQKLDGTTVASLVCKRGDFSRRWLVYETSHFSFTESTDIRFRYTNTETNSTAGTVTHPVLTLRRL